MARRTGNSKGTIYRIFVTHFSNEDQEQLVKLPRSALAREIKEKWSEEYEVPLPHLILRTAELEKILDDTPIENLANSSSAFRAIALVMDEIVDVALYLPYLSRNSSRHLKASVCDPLSEIMPEIRQLFDLDADRLVRLKVRKKVLELSSSLSSQEVDPSTPIEVDLGFKILLIEKSSDKPPSIIICFASDPLVPTLSKKSDVCFKFHGNELCLTNAVGNVFVPGDCVPSEKQPIEIVRPEQLFVFERSGLEEKNAWPQQQVETMFNPQEEAMHDSRLLPRQLHLCVLNFISGLVITSDVMKITVQLIAGRLRVIRLSGQSRLKDLFEAVASVESTSRFALSYDGAPLESSETRLRDSGLTHGALLKVTRKPALEVSIKTEPTGPAHSFELSSDVAEVRFSQLISFLKKSGCPKIGRKTVFFCEGCRRCISREKEACQSVPSPCCDVQSLSLATFQPEKKDQHETNRRVRQRVRHTCCQTGSAFCETDVLIEDLPVRVIQNSTVETEVQTDLSGHLSQKLTEDKTVSFGRVLPNDTIWFRICPPDSGKVFGIRITSEEGDTFADLIQRAVSSSLELLTLDSFSYVYQYGLYHEEDGRMKHALMNSFGSYFDLLGKKVAMEGMECSTQTPVFSIDEIVMTPGWSPLLSVDINTQFFECESGENPMDLRKPITSGYHILKESRFVAWIEFRRVFSKSDPEKVFPYLMLDKGFSGSQVIGLKHGGAFDSIEEAYAQDGFQKEDAVVETCYLLLRDKSRLPRWCIPKDSRFFINIREGVEISLVGDIVKVLNDRGGLNRWLYHRKCMADFQKAVYDCMKDRHRV